MASDHECSFVLEERVKYRLECLEASNRAQKNQMLKLEEEIKTLNENKYKEIESVKK